MKDSLDAEGQPIKVPDGNGILVPLRVPVNIDTLYDISSIQYSEFVDANGTPEQA